MHKPSGKREHSSMRNIRMNLQYDGTRYQGWQRQTSTENTIQGKLETLLSRMCEEPIEVVGSGRTDSGVHARNQVANFHTNCQMTTKEMAEYINQYLPEDIAVVELEEASPRFHSRLNATGKHYCYCVWNSKVADVFLRRYALQVEDSLDIAAMKKAASLLLGEHDFKAFTSAKKGKKSTLRIIEEIRIEKEGNQLNFHFVGNGFLHHMVRILMGTLLEVGSGKRTPESMIDLLEGGSRADAGPLIPAKGLTLMEVSFK